MKSWKKAQKNRKISLAALNYYKVLQIKRVITNQIQRIRFYFT